MTKIVLKALLNLNQAAAGVSLHRDKVMVTDSGVARVKWKVGPKGLSLVEHCRREDRGAEGVGCGEWMSPPHISPLCGAPSPENLSIFELKRASFGVLWVLFFAVD